MIISMLPLVDPSLPLLGREIIADLILATQKHVHSQYEKHLHTCKDGRRNVSLDVTPLKVLLFVDLRKLLWR